MYGDWLGYTYMYNILPGPLELEGAGVLVVCMCVSTIGRSVLDYGRGMLYAV
jgi:hypothetical protein